jgi:hypothetical protein
MQHGVQHDEQHEGAESMRVLDRDGDSSPASRPALLHTAEGITEYIGMPVAATRHLIRKGVLPTFRVGRTTMARPERIDQALDALESRTG